MAKRVDEIINPELFTLRPDERVDDALGYLLALGISGAPVCDRTGRPIGVVSFRDLCQPDRGQSVRDVMTTPAVSVTLGSSIDDAARLLAERGFHRLVVVDSEGHAAGVVSVLDVMRALIGMPISHPDAFPHYDKVTGLTWCDDTLFDVDHAARAPDGPGLLMLRVGGLRVPETTVWLEACSNVRTRVHELLSVPQENARLATLIERYHQVLRFRAAAAADPRRRRAALDALLRASDAWLTEGGRA
jgi:CBS domain-containing protein